VQYPKGRALFINQGGYEAGHTRHLSISNLTGDAPNHTYEHQQNRAVHSCRHVASAGKQPLLPPAEVRACRHAGMQECRQSYEDWLSVSGSSRTVYCDFA
jgi:hypothetical protein